MQNCGLRMRREGRERFTRHRQLAFSTSTTHVLDARGAVMHARITN